MVKLQAASLSNQVVHTRKRKRKDVPPDTNGIASEPQEEPQENADSTSTIVPTKSNDGGQKPRRTPKVGGNAQKPGSLQRSDSSVVVDTNIPWPDSFKKLEQTHKALNLVYTFCCTRKHLATTLDNIKSSVESHIGRELAISDVAKIKALVPRAINFAYVDEAMLQVNLMKEQDRTLRQAKDFIIPDPTEQDQDEEHREVLLFEYIDGDLKRQVTNKKTGEPMKVSRKLREEELKMPVYSQKQMLNLVAIALQKQLKS